MESGTIVRLTIQGTGASIVCSFGGAMAIITDFAATNNCGIFRHWEMEGQMFYDCGPKTFIVMPENQLTILPINDIILI